MCPRVLRYVVAFTLTVLLVALFACGPKVMVPPNVDLAVFEGVGIVDFTSNAEGNLADYVKQKFLQIVTASQPEARIIELGTEEDVLAAVAADKMGPKAIKAIAEEYGVEAVITGHLTVSDIKPKVSLSTEFPAIGFEAEIGASLAAKLIDAYDGATVWTDSAKGRAKVAQVNVFGDGGFFFDADDPAKAYGGLVDGLVEDVTYDLRVRYERQ